MAFSIYYVLLFAITGVIVFHYARIPFTTFPDTSVSR